MPRQRPAQENNPHVISSQDLDLLRKDIRSKKKQLVAANLKLTDSEATKFWPIYDQYTAELIAINDKKFALVQNYVGQLGENDERAVIVVYPAVVGHGHFGSAVAAEICADRVAGYWMEGSQQRFSNWTDACR
jgi:hypothetical protein